MLVLVGAVRSGRPADDPALKALASDPLPDVPKPVVIVAGGCDPNLEEDIRKYGDLLEFAFGDFRGTILSGGTRQGVAGLVGNLAERYPGRFRTLSYVPAELPGDATFDDCYTEIRRTPGANFSALEPLQGWIDLVAAGVRPAEVKVLGINGGTISAFEYRLALALGAKVGVLPESGREAGRLVGDARREPFDGLAQLCADPMTVYTFVELGIAGPLAPADRDSIGRAIHDEFRRKQQARLTAPTKPDPAMEDWEKLLPDLKASNLAQADDIDRKLRSVGKRAVRVTGREVRLYEFTPDEVERMAAMEHARWNVERFLAGWTLGPRDHAKKTSPYLVGWDDLARLPDNPQEWDRQAVRAIPKLLGDVGMEIEPIG